MKSQSTSTLSGWLIQSLGLSMAYFVVGRLSLLLAIPPGYASPVWPASGIALGGTLLFGYRVWPGILLGSFLVNIFTSFDVTCAEAVFRSLAIPAGIGAGAALQAVAGAFLIHHFGRFPTPIDHPKDIFKIIALGGPVGCLVNATLGVTILLAAGSIQGSDFILNWWTWWLGDTIGVIVVIPLVTAWNIEMEHARLRTRLSVALPLIIAVALTIVLFLNARKGEWERTRFIFEQRVDHLAQALISNVKSNIQALYSIEGLFISSQKVERREFHTFVQHHLSRHPNIKALEWIPRVPDPRRAAYEEEIRRAGYPDFHITELNPQGQLVRASRRVEYFPVSYIEPFKGNEKVLGLDLASNPQRRDALHRARKSGKLSATSRITLVQETENQFGILVFLPIYTKDVFQKIVEKKKERLQGYVLGVLRIGDMVETAMKPFDRQGIECRLYDNTAPGGERLLYISDRSMPGARDAIMGDEPREPETRLQWDSTFDMANRSWTIKFYATSEYFTAHRPSEAYAIIIGGLFFSSLLGAFLVMAAGRTAITERRVIEKTAELSQANILLKEEVIERERAEVALREAQSTLEATVEKRTAELRLANEQLRQEIIHRKASEAALGKANLALKAVSSCNMILVQAKEESVLLDDTCRVFVEVGGYRMAWIGYAEQDERKTVRPVAQTGDEEGYLQTLNLTWKDIETGRGPTGTAIRTGKPSVVKDITTEPGFAPWRKEALKRNYASSIALPLKANSITLGALNIYAPEPDAFGSEEIKLLTELADNLAYGILALRNRAEHEKVQKMLQESESRLRELVESAPDAILIVDQNGRIQLANKQVENMFGYNQMELNDLTHDVLLPDRLQAVHAKHRRNYHLTPRSRPMGIGLDLYGRRKDGSEIPVEISLSPITIKEEIHVVSIIRDITERKRMEESLKERLGELKILNALGRKVNASLSIDQVSRAAIEGIVAAVVPDMVIFYINEGEDLVLHQFYSGNPKDSRDDHHGHQVGICLCGLAAKSRKPVYSHNIRSDSRCTMTECKKAGYHSFAALPLIVGEDIHGVLGLASLNERNFEDQAIFLETLAHQISVGLQNALFYRQLQHQADDLEQQVDRRTAELKIAMERARESDRLKSAFLATMSHELRTPLNSVIGFTGIILKGLAGPLNEEQNKQLGMVQNSARHLLNLINDVLDISKIEAGQLEIESEPFDIREAVEKAVQTVSPLAREKKLSINADISGGVDKINSDQRRVEQILINLITNAVKFTEKGSVNVNCSVKDQWLFIQVKDTGIGISPEDMNTLFAVFHQLDKGLTRNYEGTGLGLSICKKLVEMLGGRIWADSEGWGKGSTFSFTLPVKLKGDENEEDSSH